MTEEQTILSKRAVACKGWRWMPGMATVHGERVVTIDDDGTLRLAAPWVGTTVGLTAVRSFYDSSGRCLPDLTDSATLGCLLALVREAWGMPTGITVSYSSDEGLWGVSWSGSTHGGWCGRGTTEAEAFVAALEAAP